jgi:RNA polymerase sigma-70 factor (ECF subfamily)
MKRDTTILKGPQGFQTTQWTLVQSAGDAKAMEALIRLYWKPLYFFVRHHGHDREEAKDIVQGFLTDLLERGAILKADPARGRFRTFLRAAMTNFLRDRAKAETRKKRKASRPVLSLDFARGEREYSIQVAAGESPERVLDRAWARSLWEDALARLEGEPAHLAAFRMYLTDAGYAAIAKETGLSEGAAKVAVHRLKARFKELILERMRETVSSAGELNAEVAEFKSLLA